MGSVYDFMTYVYQFMVSLGLHYVVIACAVIAAVAFLLKRSSS